MSCVSKAQPCKAFVPVPVSTPAPLTRSFCCRRSLAHEPCPAYQFLTSSACASCSAARVTAVPWYDYGFGSSITASETEASTTPPHWLSCYRIGPPRPPLRPSRQAAAATAGPPPCSAAPTRGAARRLHGVAHGPDADLAVGVAAVQGGAVGGPGQGHAVGHLGLLGGDVELGAQVVHDALAARGNRQEDIGTRRSSEARKGRKARAWEWSEANWQCLSGTTM